MWRFISDQEVDHVYTYITQPLRFNSLGQIAYAFCYGIPGYRREDAIFAHVTNARRVRKIMGTFSKQDSILYDVKNQHVEATILAYCDNEGLEVKRFADCDDFYCFKILEIAQETSKKTNISIQFQCNELCILTELLVEKIRWQQHNLPDAEKSDLLPLLEMFLEKLRLFSAALEEDRKIVEAARVVQQVSDEIKDGFLKCMSQEVVPTVIVPAGLTMISTVTTAMLNSMHMPIEGAAGLAFGAVFGPKIIDRFKKTN